MSRWYIIHAYSGFENKVKDAILSEATRLGLQSQVEAVEVPTEKVTEIRRGKTGLRPCERPQFKPIRASRPSGGSRHRAGFAVHH